MKNHKLCPTILLLAALVPPMAMATQESGFTNPLAKQHVDAAFRIAGSDLKEQAASMCRMPKAAAKPGGMPDMNRKPFEPTRVFDNLYYFGSPFVGASVIKTSAGLILIDTLTLSEHTATQLVAGMRQMGLDPADIKYVIITHGHGDHFGGVSYLREHFTGFKTIASNTDWPAMGTPTKMRSGEPDPAPRAPRAAGDIGYSGTYTLTLGDETVRLFQTPGHTPGTTSLLYQVKSGGQPITVMQWGGGQPIDPRVSLDTVKTFAAAAKDEKAAVRWGSHARPDWPALRAQIVAGQPNPLIEGPERISRYLDIVVECKEAIAAQTR